MQASGELIQDDGVNPDWQNNYNHIGFTFSNNTLEVKVIKNQIEQKKLPGIFK
jgi:hypothetical protein